MRDPHAHAVPCFQSLGYRRVIFSGIDAAIDYEIGCACQLLCKVTRGTDTHTLDLVHLCSYLHLARQTPANLF